MKRRKRREKLFVGMAFILCIGLVAMLFSINRKEKTDSIFCRGLDYMGNAMAFFPSPDTTPVFEKKPSHYPYNPNHDKKWNPSSLCD